ncbi:cysteine desulfurase sulfur acceptor subunit CsdE [Shimwellia pseudoproteus]|uniref:cysteine desulfurase sulfur acceptor subunit CsdE n=1 Tax=Shimwellia pseudoproteus TaxID=570012 RepID=UPI0018EB9516|nr:cysteine desulfurase sulfur acceptor subunit CsdE [Shimwellia pseudoproteus]MBJ3813819.1 cysteine desulfurase sulfur acceptor subunit CsdE [Shimwellia pseudoproteus]
MTTAHPFGTTITVDQLTAQFAAARQWEDKYRLLIQLGKTLPPLAEQYKTPDIEIAGCENRVWLGHTRLSDGRLHFYGESEGRIVRGLLAVLLTAVEGKTAPALRQMDPGALFATLGLQHQLSASRGQGLAALIAAVNRAAQD